MPYNTIEGKSDMYGGRIYRKFGWADESLANLDRADFTKLGRAISLSRSYCAASSREVAWRHVRGESETPCFDDADSDCTGQDHRINQWDKATRQYADELRAAARVKHAYSPMSTGFCMVCGEREYARISETSFGVTVWRRVHTNPLIDDVRHMFDNVPMDMTSRRHGKEVCGGSGWHAPAGWTSSHFECVECKKKVLVITNGTLRKHYL